MNSADTLACGEIETTSIVRRATSERPFAVTVAVKTQL